MVHDAEVSSGQVVGASVGHTTAAQKHPSDKGCILQLISDFEMSQQQHGTSSSSASSSCTGSVGMGVVGVDVGVNSG